MKHRSVPSLLRFAAVLLGARTLAACADAGASGSERDAAAVFCVEGLGVGRSCIHHSECANNLVCDKSANGASGFCRAVTGQCDPSGDPSNRCYEGARCEAVGGGGGVCTLANQAVRFFPTASPQRVVRPAERAVERRLVAPETTLRSFTFEWERPPDVSAGALTVVVVMKVQPRRDATTNRLTNVSDVVWVWSTDLRNGTSEQSVNLDRGRRGFTADGRLSSAPSTELQVGKYWYFVYTLDRGRVSAASDLRTLQVLSSTDAPAGTCRATNDCVRGDDNNDQWECVAQRCMRRCSHPSDCVGTGGRCALDTPQCSMLPRNSAFCRAL